MFRRDAYIRHKLFIWHVAYGKHERIQEGGPPIFGSQIIFYIVYNVWKNVWNWIWIL